MLGERRGIPPRHYNRWLLRYNPAMLPRARKKDLVVEHIDDETLVYDLKTHRAHCLNRTASLVWRYCDGKSDVAAMTKKLTVATGTKVSRDVVDLALLRLRAARLLQDESAKLPKAKYSRRELIQNIGKAAAIALPIV